MSFLGSLGALVVSLTANTAEFTGDMGKAAHEAAKRMADIEASAKKLGVAIGVAIGGAVTATAIGVKNAIDRADELSKQAAIVGETTEEFGKLAYAAELAGVNQQELVTALTKVGESAIDAIRGNKDLAATWDALGISVTDANGNLKNNSTLLKELSAVLPKFKGTAVEAAVAKDLLGKAGAKLIPMLNGEKEGLIAAGEEAEKFGLILSQDVASAAEQVNDNITRLTKVKEGFFNVVMKNLLPSLEAMTNRMVESAKAGDRLESAARAAATGVRLLSSFGAIVAGVFKAIGEYLGAVGAQVMKLFEGDFQGALEIGKMANADFVENVRSTMGDLDAIWTEETSKVSQTAEKGGEAAAGNFVRKISKIKDESKKVFEAVEKQIESLSVRFSTLGLSEVESELTRLFEAGATDEQLDQAEQYLKAIEQYKIKQEESANAIERWKQEQEEALEVMKSVEDPIQTLQLQYDKLNKLLARGAIDFDTYSKAIIKAEEDMAAKTTQNKDRFDELLRAVEGFGNRAADALTDFVMTGKGDFKSLINSFIADLLRMEALSAFKTLFGGAGGGGGGMGDIIGMGVSFLGGLFGGARAIGGGMSQGRSYLVGENGPEMVTMGAAGTASQVGGGNVSVNQKIYVDSRSDQSSIMQAMRQAKQEAVVAVREEFRRNGPVTKYA